MWICIWEPAINIVVVHCTRFFMNIDGGEMGMFRMKRCFFSLLVSLCVLLMIMPSMAASIKQDGLDITLVSFHIAHEYSFG